MLLVGVLLAGAVIWLGPMARSLVQQTLDGQAMPGHRRHADAAAEPTEQEFAVYHAYNALKDNTSLPDEEIRKRLASQFAVSPGYVQASYRKIMDFRLTDETHSILKDRIRDVLRSFNVELKDEIGIQGDLAFVNYRENLTGISDRAALDSAVDRATSVARRIFEAAPEINRVSIGILFKISNGIDATKVLQFTRRALMGGEAPAYP